MFTINGNFQYIDWSHDPVEPEPFDHLGTMETYIISPGVTIGLTEYLNFDYKQYEYFGFEKWYNENKKVFYKFKKIFFVKR